MIYNYLCSQALYKFKEQHDQEMLMKEKNDIQYTTKIDSVTQEQLNNILDNSTTHNLNNSYFKNNSTSLELRLDKN